MRFRCSDIFGPTPHSSCTSSGQKSAAETLLVEQREPARLVHARCHLGDELVGADADRGTEPVLVGDALLDVRARSRAPPRASRRDRPAGRRSRNASSTLNGSTSGVTVRKISSSSSDFSTYLRGLPSTYSACGQSRFASPSGMPARTPNGRASYDAAVTTPRRSGSPQTITGRPRRCGWCACSTDAKNASMSTSRIIALRCATLGRLAARTQPGAVHARLRIHFGPRAS